MSGTASIGTSFHATWRGLERIGPWRTSASPLGSTSKLAPIWRVSLARALVAEPELLLLDEPFGALDALTRLTMRGLLLDLWREHGFGVLLVTHDVDEAVALADRVLVLEEGRVVHTLTIEEPRLPAGEATAETEHHRADLLDQLGVRI